MNVINIRFFEPVITSCLCIRVRSTVWCHTFFIMLFFAQRRHRFILDLTTARQHYCHEKRKEYYIMYICSTSCQCSITWLYSPFPITLVLPSFHLHLFIYPKAQISYKHLSSRTYVRFWLGTLLFLFLVWNKTQTERIFLIFCAKYVDKLRMKQNKKHSFQFKKSTTLLRSPVYNLFWQQYARHPTRRISQVTQRRTASVLLLTLNPTLRSNHKSLFLHQLEFNNTMSLLLFLSPTFS